MAAEQVQVKRLHALTALRFVAAFMIVLHHSRGVSLLPTNTAFFGLELYQAVAFFFVLSGFILTYVYPKFDSWNDRGRFLFARFARIWPAHVASFILLVLLMHRLDHLHLTDMHHALRVGAVNLAMLHSWVPKAEYYFSYNAVSWSISTEFGFYLMFPFLIHRWEKSWWWKLALTLGLAATMCAIARMTGLKSYDGNDAHWRLVNSTGLIYINPLARVFEFTLGMCTALLWKKIGPKLRLGTGSKRVRMRLIGTVVELLVLAIVVAVMRSTNTVIPWVQHISWMGAEGATWLRQGGLVVPVFALLIFIMATEWGCVSLMLSAPFCVLLGEISYSVYLVHQVLLREYVWYPDVMKHFDWQPLFAIYVVVVLMTSHLIWATVERPMRRGLLRFWPKRKAGIAATHARPSAALAFAGAGSSIPSAASAATSLPEHPVSHGGSVKTIATGNGGGKGAGNAGNDPRTLRAALETPGQGAGRRSFFQAMLEPGLKVIAYEALLLALIIAGFLTFAWWPRTRPLSGNTTATYAGLLAHAAPGTRDVTFGDAFLLHGAVLERSNKGLEVHLIWESLKTVRLRYNEGVHLLSPAGPDGKRKILAQKDLVQDYDRRYAMPHDVWEETAILSPAHIAQASAVGLSIYEGRNLLPVNKGDRDWDNSRLIVPLTPADLAPPADTQPAPLPAAPAKPHGTVREFNGDDVP